MLSAGVTENDTVLEIGCGAGALTRAIAKKAKSVVSQTTDSQKKKKRGKNEKD